LGLPYTAFNEILNGKRPVTTDFALFMEAALGVPAYILVGMQTDYNLQVAQKDSKESQFRHLKIDKPSWIQTLLPDRALPKDNPDDECYPDNAAFPDKKRNARDSDVRFFQ